MLSAAEPRVFVAFDFDDAAAALSLLERLDPRECGIKIGNEVFTVAGPDLVKQIVARRFNVFLDLKFHDIPNTVARACAAATRLGVWMLNLEKSKDAAFDSQTLTNLPAPGGGYISTRSQVGKENKTSSTEVHPVVFDGKPHKTAGGDAREITYKLIDAYTFERTHNRNGKISVDTEQVSKDGKTMTVKQANATRIYDKKFDVKQVGR